MIIGLDVLAGEVCVTDGWLKLLVLKVGVRGGELLGRLFPCEEPFFEFFLGELKLILVPTPGVTGVTGVTGVPGEVGVPGEFGGIVELGDKGT